MHYRSHRPFNSTPLSDLFFFNAFGLSISIIDNNVVFVANKNVFFFKKNKKNPFFKSNCANRFDNVYCRHVCSNYLLDLSSFFVFCSFSLYGSVEQWCGSWFHQSNIRLSSSLPLCPQDISLSSRDFSVVLIDVFEWSQALAEWLWLCFYWIWCQARCVFHDDKV